VVLFFSRRIRDDTVAIGWQGSGRLLGRLYELNNLPTLLIDDIFIPAEIAGNVELDDLCHDRATPRPVPL
jgi:hypothetical protein